MCQTLGLNQVKPWSSPQISSNMAKSLRSKRRRKMRAIKRVRYGAKELERLKETLGHGDVKKEIDEVMAEVSEVVTVTETKKIKEKAKEKDIEAVQMDDDTVKHTYSAKTMKDQYGSYPVWMNQRKINKKKKARKGRPKRK
ncbi:hypothetical protein CBL_11684 [Carabus blaptoides fortunei]